MIYLYWNILEHGISPHQFAPVPKTKSSHLKNEVWMLKFGSWKVPLFFRSLAVRCHRFKAKKNIMFCSSPVGCFSETYTPKNQQKLEPKISPKWKSGSNHLPSHPPPFFWRSSRSFFPVVWSTFAPERLWDSTNHRCWRRRQWHSHAPRCRRVAAVVFVHESYRWFWAFFGGCSWNLNIKCGCFVVFFFPFKIRFSSAVFEKIDSSSCKRPELCCCFPNAP